MHVELLDGRTAGNIRDIDNGTAIELIRLGRARRAFGQPTDAAPPLPGGYRGTTPAEPLVVVRLDEPTDLESKSVKPSTAPAKAKNRR